MKEYKVECTSGHDLEKVLNYYTKAGYDLVGIYIELCGGCFNLYRVVFSKTEVKQNEPV